MAPPEASTAITSPSPQISSEDAKQATSMFDQVFEEIVCREGRVRKEGQEGGRSFITIAFRLSYLGLSFTFSIASRFSVNGRLPD